MQKEIEIPGGRRRTRKSTFFKHLPELMSGWKVATYYVLLVTLYTLTFNYIMQNSVISFIYSLIMAVPSMYYIVYLNAKTKKYMTNLKLLNKYSTSLTFSLKNGNTVLSSLEDAATYNEGEVLEALEKTIAYKRETSKLDTSFFLKFQFKAMNAYHNLLKIKDEQGGNAEAMFGEANKEVNKSMANMDKALREKLGTARQLYVMVGIAAAIPFILAIMASGLYEAFVSYPTSLVLLIAFYTMIFWCVFYIEKEKADFKLLQ